MKYTKQTFVNDTSPAIDADWLNAVGDTLKTLSLNSINLATVNSGTTSSNYNLTISGYTTSPSSGELPVFFCLSPSVTNISPCTITPSWGSTAYSVYDPKRNAAIQAGDIISGTLVLLAFDGTHFWCFGSKGLVSGTDYATPASVSAKYDKPIQASSLSVATSAWASDSTYTDYPYRATVAIADVTATMIPYVTFIPSDAISGILCPVANSYAGGIYIYAASIPSAAVSIASVIAWKAV